MQPTKHAPANQNKPYPQIIVTGDSIAYQAFRGGGYGVRLAGEYNGLFDVLNRGFPGYSSTQLLQKIRDGLHIAPSAEVVLIIIQIGTNDCVVDGIQTIPLHRYADNLYACFETIRERYPSAGIICISPAKSIPDLSREFNGRIGLPSHLVSRLLRTNEAAQDYADETERVCKVARVPCVNAFREFDRAIQDGIAPERLMPDGLHWSASAFSIVNKALFDVIRTSFPDLLPSRQQIPFQSFAELGHEGDAEWGEMKRILPQVMRNMAELHYELRAKFAR